jgi:hypothetical protein
VQQPNEPKKEEKDEKVLRIFSEKEPSLKPQNFPALDLEKKKKTKRKRKKKWS